MYFQKIIMYKILPEGRGSIASSRAYLEYLGPNSCRVAHPMGGLCRQPISGRCVKHVGPMMVHCWAADWVFNVANFETDSSSSLTDTYLI